MFPDALRRCLAGLLAGMACAVTGAPEMACTRSPDGRRTECVPHGANSAPAPAPVVAAPRALALYLAQIIATRDPRAPDAGTGLLVLALRDRAPSPMALLYLERALEVDRRAGFVRGQLSLLNQIAIMLIQAGDHANADQRLTEALALARRDGLRDAEGAVLANSGVVLALRGDYAGAQRTTSMAIQAYATLPARASTPPVQHPRSLQGWRQELHQRPQSPEGLLLLLQQQEVAMGRELCLLNLGTVHAQLGQYSEAAAAYDQALSVYPGPPGVSGSGTILRAKAQLFRLAGRNDEAAALDRLVDAAGDSTVGYLGQSPTVVLQRVMPSALATATAARPARPAGTAASAARLQQRPLVPAILLALSARPPSEQLAISLDAAARNTESGQLEEAAANWRHAAAMAQIADAGSGLVAALAGSQNLSLDQRQRALSIYYGKRAVREIQRQRQQMAQMDRNARNTFAARSRPIYETLASALMDAGRLLEAELAMQLMREDAASDFAAHAGGLPFNAAESALLAHDQEGVRLWKAHTGARAVNTQFAGVPPLSEEEMINLRQHQATLPGGQGLSSESPTALCLKPGAETTTPRITMAPGIDAAWCFQVRGTVIAKRVSAPAAALAEGLKALEHRFDPADQALLEAGRSWLATAAPGTVALQYLVGPQRLQMLATSARSVSMRQVPVSRDALESLIDRFLLAMERRDRDIRQPARELHRLLIEPLQPDLAKMSAQTLLLSLDGRLRYLPMAALHDGERWLAESHAVALATPARLPAFRPSARAWRIAAFGSTRAQPRLKLDALPNAGAEIAALVREGDGSGGGVVPGTARVDAAFTAEALKAALAQRVPIVHLATHFVLGDADGSFLLLGDGTELKLRSIRQDFRFDGVELVTLSACETARDVRNQAWSQEFEGLSAALRAQGAATVLATLWKVDDAATSRFMQDYYRLLTAQPALGKARALQEAQRLLIDAGKAPAGSGKALRSGSFGEPEAPVDPATEIAHPAYWAPFVLLGDVR